jgi:hypothetical protein
VIFTASTSYWVKTIHAEARKNRSVANLWSAVDSSGGDCGHLFAVFRNSALSAMRGTPFWLALCGVDTSEALTARLGLLPQ